MSLTKFPKGIQTSHVISAETTNSSGKVFFVCNSTVHRPDGVAGADVAGLGQDPTRPFATIDFAIGQCVANRGDTIFVMEGHAETLSSAGAITLDVAGVSIIGLGTGNSRPTLTFSTLTTASFVSSANHVKVHNIVGISGIDGLTNPFNITSDYSSFDIIWYDSSNTVEAASVLSLSSSNSSKVNLEFIGLNNGNAGVNHIKLNNCYDLDIFVNFYGIASTAVVDMITAASQHIRIKGYIYNSGTTNGSKLVVDTIGGSTWYAEIQDGAAGAKYSGGSGAALAADDVSSISSALLVPTADVTTNTNERDVIGNKTDAAVTAVGTTKSITAYAKGLVTMNTVQSADSTNNAFAGDVIGNKTDASVYVPGTTKSLASYAKGISDLQERVALSSTAVMVNGNTIFTIAGGPIQILALVSECVTANDGTASTVQYSVTPTIGSAQTISAASASIANATAGASITLAGTALSTAALYNSNGPNLIANPGTIYAPAGTITVVVGVGSTTGTWRHRIRYKPLAVGVTVS